MLSIDELFMLRQASFTFWRIYGDEAFREFHGFLGSHQRAGKLFSGFEGNRIVVLRAKQNGCCRPCAYSRSAYLHFMSRRRMRFTMRAIFCLGCQAQHNWTHFSPSQRMMSWASGLCVGWEGRFRVCSHQTISMPEMWNCVKRNGGKEGLISIQPRSPKPLTCRTCEAIALKSLPKTGRARERIAVPSVILELEPFNPHNPPQRVKFKLSWTLPIFKLPKNELVSVGFLQQQLKAFGAAYGSNMLCHHVSLDSSFLLRPFDPRYCVCLGGDDRLGGFTPLDKQLDSQADSGIPPSFCKKNAFQAGTVEGGAQLVPQQAFLSSSTLPHSVACRSCRTLYWWSRTEDQVFLTRRWTGRLFGRGMSNHDGKWEKALIDPMSCGGTPDPNLKHYFWCDDRECRNGRSWEEYSKCFSL